MLVTEAMDDPRSRGLVDNQRLEDFLRLLDDHKVSVDAVAGLDRTVRALAVSNGERAALAIIDGDRVGLLEIRETGIAREIVKVLPGAVPGPGTAVNVRVQSLQDAVVIHEAERAADASDLFAGGGRPWSRLVCPRRTRSSSRSSRPTAWPVASSARPRTGRGRGS